MSRSFVLTATVIALLVSGCGGTYTPIPEIIDGQPSTPAGLLSESITSTKIIPLERVDLSTAMGWPEGASEFELVGATTADENPDGVIGVLHIADNTEAVYPPGTYLVILLSDIQQQTPTVLLKDQDGNELNPLDAEYENLGLEPEKNHFLFIEGSLRCDWCPRWLGGLCLCVKCKQ